MVAIAEELGLDLCEVMQARPFGFPKNGITPWRK